MNFDETVTDLDVNIPLIDPDGEWLPKAETSEPDLDIDGLPGSMVSRILRFFQRS